MSAGQQNERHHPVPRLQSRQLGRSCRCCRRCKVLCMPSSAARRHPQQSASLATTLQWQQSAGSWKSCGHPPLWSPLPRYQLAAHGPQQQPWWQRCAQPRGERLPRRRPPLVLLRAHLPMLPGTLARRWVNAATDPLLFMFRTGSAHALCWHTLSVGDAWPVLPVSGRGCCFLWVLGLREILGNNR